MLHSATGVGSFINTINISEKKAKILPVSVMSVHVLTVSVHVLPVSFVSVYVHEAHR
jgi:hypothetical protein